MISKTKKNQKKYIILFVVVLLILFMISYFSANKEEAEEEIVETDEMVQEKYDNTQLQKLYDMEERDRMEYYFKVFLNHVEEGEYEEAYDLLYDEFKENYFPTLESFEEYITSIFTEMTDIKHENIERNGNIYVLWIYITDAINGQQLDMRKMNFIIKENDYNDFVISFSVI